MDRTNIFGQRVQQLNSKESENRIQSVLVKQGPTQLCFVSSKGINLHTRRGRLTWTEARIAPHINGRIPNPITSKSTWYHLWPCAFCGAGATHVVWQELHTSTSNPLDLTPLGTAPHQASINCPTLLTYSLYTAGISRAMAAGGTRAVYLSPRCKTAGLLTKWELPPMPPIVSTAR